MPDPNEPMSSGDWEAWDEALRSASRPSRPRPSGVGSAVSEAARGLADGTLAAQVFGEALEAVRADRLRREHADRVWGSAEGTIRVDEDVEMARALESIRAAGITVDRGAILDELLVHVGVDPGAGDLTGPYPVPVPVMGIGSDLPIDYIPVRTELTVLPADEPGPPIGFRIFEYMGPPIFRWVDVEGVLGTGGDPRNDLPRLTRPEDIREGMEVGIPWMSGYARMRILVDHLGELFARGDNLMCPLRFDDDDRHCWTAAGFVNLRGVERLEVQTEMIVMKCLTCGDMTSHLNGLCGPCYNMGLRGVTEKGLIFDMGSFESWAGKTTLGTGLGPEWLARVKATFLAVKNPEPKDARTVWERLDEDDS